MSDSPFDAYLQDLARLDFMTYQHSVAVAEAMNSLAVKLGMTGDSVLEAELLGALHDLAKLKVAPNIFKKMQAGKGLTDEERRQIQQGPDVLLEVLGDNLLNENLLEAIRHMGCHFDGRGTPDTEGEAIPVLARMLKICDYADMLSRQRIGRPSLDEDKVREVLKVQSGKIFDPVMVEVFLDG